MSILYLLHLFADNQWGLPEAKLNQGNLGNLLQIVFGLAGALSIMLVTYGALKYSLSQGDPQATAKAKDTIMYAVIGAVLCVFAFGIVSFVMRSV